MQRKNRFTLKNLKREYVGTAKAEDLAIPIFSLIESALMLALESEGLLVTSESEGRLSASGLPFPSGMTAPNRSEVNNKRMKEKKNE